MNQIKSKIGYNPDISITEYIDSNYNNKTIKHYIKRKLNFSTELIKRAKYRGSITLNGKCTKVDKIIQNGDILYINIPECVDVPCKPYALPLDVIYEDNYILIVNKTAPLPCLCGPNDCANTLQNAIYSYFNQPEYFAFRPVNRLDAGTSGLMLIAKNAYAQSSIQNILHSDKFIREYLAIVVDNNLPDNGEINMPIQRISNNMYAVGPDGKPSKTTYRVLYRNSGNALAQVRLYTGRTHQIRVHFAYLNCPVLGDYVYGTEHNFLPKRFALHSYFMQITLPSSRKTLKLYAPIPNEFKKILYN